MFFVFNAPQHLNQSIKTCSYRAVYRK